MNGSVGVLLVVDLSMWIWKMISIRTWPTAIRNITSVVLNAVKRSIQQSLTEISFCSSTYNNRICSSVTRMRTATSCTSLRSPAFAHITTEPKSMMSQNSHCSLYRSVSSIWAMNAGTVVMLSSRGT